MDDIIFDLGRDSEGNFIGCIGALNRLVVWIKCPTLWKVVADPGNYFYQKNFYALKVQADCDKRKRITWISPEYPGTSQYWTTWSETQLVELLDEMKDNSRHHWFFSIRDSCFQHFSSQIITLISSEAMPWSSSHSLIHLFNFSRQSYQDYHTSILVHFFSSIQHLITHLLSKWLIMF